MEGFWPIFYLAVVLKIPVAFSIWLVIWAMKRHDAASGSGGGGNGPGRRIGTRRPRGPVGPRRGPHHGRPATGRRQHSRASGGRTPSRAGSRSPSRAGRRTPSRAGRRSPSRG